MKTNLLRIGAWAVITILGGAGSASARVVDRFNQKGKSALAVCSQSQPIECEFGPGFLQSDIFVSGDEFVTESSTFPTEATNNLFVTARQYNSCTDQFSGTFGSLPNGYSHQSLQSAELQGTVPLFDFETGNPAGEIDVNVSLEGFGNVTQGEREHFHFEFEGPEGTTIKIFGGFTGKSRSATASGTLVMNGTPIDCTFTDAFLSDVQSGSKTLELH